MVFIPFAYQEVNADLVRVFLNPTFDGFLTDLDNDDECDATIGNIINNSTGTTVFFGSPNVTDNNIDCYRAYFEYDLSLIPVGSQVTDVDIILQEAADHGLNNCEIFAILTNRPSTVSTDAELLALWDELHTNSYTDANCDGSSSPYDRDIGNQVGFDIEDRLGTINWIGLAWTHNNEQPQNSVRWIEFFSVDRLNGGQLPILEVEYEDPNYTVSTLNALADGEHKRIRDEGNNNLCDGNVLTEATNTGFISVYDADDADNDCSRIWYEWDLSGLPPNANVVNVNFEGDVIQGDGSCDYVLLSARPSLETTADNWNAIETDQTTMFNTGNTGINFGCNVGGDHQFNLGVNATAYANAQISEGWFALGVKKNNETLVSGSAQTQSIDIVAPPDIRIIIAHENGIPDPITDLAVLVVGDTALDLVWSVPDLHGSTLNGSQINFTTPFGDPLTIITNNTNTTDTESSITGLTSDTDYSFRLGVWTDFGSNQNGNIGNATTADFGNFTVGFSDLSASNFDARDIKYTRVDLNSTHTNLEIVHPNAFNLTCNFYYKLAIKNDTYANLPTVPEGTMNEQKATFQFHDIQNDIIDVRCTDVNTNVSADYLLTQANFELLTQFFNFRSGEYGTSGMFGSIDLITLGAIIVAMIGFNRVNESVGAIFAVIILGVLSYFQIVVWQTFMFGTVAIVLMLVIASTRKQ